MTPFCSILFIFNLFLLISVLRGISTSICPFNGIKDFIIITANLTRLKVAITEVLLLCHAYWKFLNLL